MPKEIKMVLFDKGFTGRVFVTMNQTVVGRLPNDMLMQIGFSKAIIKASPALCFRNGWRHFLDYLAQRGVRQVVHRSKARKHYLTFLLNGAEEHAAD